MSERLIDKSCGEFAAVLASKAPVPGGGGAAALVGAFGIALCSMEELMHRLGDPQNELRFIHVAGTNGKGSVCAMLASVLTNAGYQTGLYTSPHLLRVNERMKVGGTEVTDQELIALAAEVKKQADRMADRPTEFEILTAMRERTSMKFSGSSQTSRCARSQRLPAISTFFF